MAKIKPMNEIRLAVCMPSGETWMAETARCVTLMFSRFHIERVPGAHHQSIAILNVRGSMLGQQRELILKKILQNNFTHLLFIDSDMVFPMDLPQRLLRHKKECVAANCTTRAKPILPVAHDLDGNRINSMGKHGLQEVQHVGCAVMLLEAQALRRLDPPPHFLQDWVPAFDAYCGEDVYFCQLLRDKGVTLWIDHDVSREIGHIGYVTWSMKDVDEGVMEEELGRVANG